MSMILERFVPPPIKSNVIPATVEESYGFFRWLPVSKDCPWVLLILPEYV